MPAITVCWYGPLRDRAGAPEQALADAPATPAAVWDALLPGVPRAGVAVAVGDELAPWDRPLRDGDALHLLPPVAGG